MNLKELSFKLGLSQTTVSRALNGYPEVSEATRARVLSLAKEYDYTPNARAKGLATGKALAIGHVIPMSSRNEMMNPIFGDFLAGAGETYARHGYEMVIKMVPAEGSEESVYRNLKARSAVDGVVVQSPLMNDPRIALLQEMGLPFVCHGRSRGIETPYAWLDVNNAAAFERLTDLLLDLDHRKIALINGREEVDFAYQRRKGFEKACLGRGVTPQPEWMVSHEMTEDNGYASAIGMLELADPPTAFVTSSIILAMGVRRAIEEKGLVMGRDVSVVTHDDDLSYMKNGGARPIFTATRSSVRDAGGQIADMLIRQISEARAPVETVCYEAELVLGQSSGHAPG